MISTKWNYSFGHRIREMRKAKKWSVFDLAHALGLKSLGYISKIEVRNEIPSPQMVMRLVKVFGEEPRELFDLAKRDKCFQLEQKINKKYNEVLADAKANRSL